MEFSIGEHGRGPTAYDIDIVQLLELHGPPKEPPLGAPVNYPMPFPHPARPHHYPPLPSAKWESAVASLWDAIVCGRGTAWKAVFILNSTVFSVFGLSVNFACSTIHDYVLST